jgi:LGFP repeat-containing protein
MSDELLVSAVLARPDDLEVLRKRIRKDGSLSAEELAEVAKLPPDLFDGQEGRAELARALVPFIPPILENLVKANEAIEAKAASLGWIGNPTTNIQYAHHDCYLQHFEHASIYYTPASGAHEVHGAIRDFYLRLGGHLSYLGFPMTDELSSGDVRYSNFGGGTILWTATRGAFMNPSYSPSTQRYQTGIYLLSRGTGFTPGGRVSLWVLNEGLAPKSIGSTYAEPDGRFGTASPYSSFIYFRPGDHPLSRARATDEATGHSDEYPLSYSVL